VHEARQRLASLTPPAQVRLRIAPHAPYSTSADLIRAIAGCHSGDGWPITSIHLAESSEEIEFLRTGRGPFRTLLEDLAVPLESWQSTPQLPACYIDGLGLWRPGAMAIHGVHLTKADLDLLAARDVTVVTCPRSNAWVGGGAPPVREFVSSGVRVAIGTDSLASVSDLNLFQELRHLRTLAPDVPARVLLSWATRNGAQALGLEADFGSLMPGRAARFLAVRVGAGLIDIEEALVGGIAPGDITWIEADASRAAGPA
jgi:cytosine/adenosine deaminase-related metal-dependent hydrolase